jgi:PilZ domain-containing protein
MQPTPSSSAPDEPNPADRREAPRTRRQVRVQITDADAKNPPATAWVSDCSLGGLCLSVKEETPVGTVLSVRPATAPPGVTWVQIQVKSQRRFEGVWELGCQFVRTPSYSVLLMFS